MNEINELKVEKIINGSEYSKAFFDFGGVKISEQNYEIKFGLSYPFNLLNVQDKTFSNSKVREFGYDSKAYFGNTYPFEFLKAYYVEFNNLNNHTYQNITYSGGVFELFTKEAINGQYYSYLILKWCEFIGQNLNEYEYLNHSKYNILSDLILCEKHSSISEFTIHEIKVLELLFKENIDKFIIETLNSTNQTAYLNKVISFIIKDYLFLRKISLTKENQFFSFYFFMLNNLYIKLFKFLVGDFETSISEENNESIKSFLTKIKSKKTAFELNDKLPKNQLLEAVSKLRDSLIEGKFISEIKTSDFIVFLESRKIPNSKIDWLDNKTSLFTFYKLLYENKIIKDSKNEHWKIICLHFSIKGNNIFPYDLVGLKRSANNKKNKKLESIIKNFKENTLTH